MARTREFDTDKFLDKAISLFWHKGYNGISTQELADAFHISKSSMYAAFGDKKQLYTAALEKYRTQIADDTVQRLKNCKNVKTEIKNILVSIVKKSLIDKDRKGCFIVNSCIELAPHDENISTIVQDHRKIMEAAFAAAIRRGIADKEFSTNINPETISIIICNAINGIQVDAKYLKGNKYFENIINSIISLLH